MATDIEGNILKAGDRVVIPFIVAGVHGDGVALDPIDPRDLKHPRVTYDSRLCQRTVKANERDEE